MHRLSRWSSELTEVRRWCRGSDNYRCYFYCLLLLVREVRYVAAAVVGSFCCKPKTRKQAVVPGMYTDAACRLVKY